MKPFDVRWAVAAVAIFLCIGTVGFVKSHPAQLPLQSLGSAATMLSGSLLSKAHLEMPGTKPPIGETLMRSAKEVGGSAAEEAADEPAADGTSPQPSPPADPGADAQAAEEDAEVATPAAAQPAEPPAEPLEAGEEAAPEAGREMVFIYHSHNRESWIPELKGKDQASEAFDADVNVSLLGKRMKETLEAKGIGAVHSQTDYSKAVPNFNYNFSYKYSKTTVKEALAVYRDLNYFIDIHRDSQRREGTTITIDGADYAKLYFIIGQGNPNWKANEALAKRIHESIEKKFPGVSKGILTKGTKHGDGEYNQSLSSGSLLIEVGGVDNTLEESYRTIDLLAAAIAELIRDAKQADAPADPERATANPT